MQISDQVSKPVMSEEVHHAQVDAAHLGPVVVDHAHASGGIRGVDCHFFLQFAVHPFLVGIPAAVGVCVDRRDVPANAHAVLAVQPSFALAGAPGVLEHGLASLAVGVAEDHVGNQLLEAGIQLHLPAGAVAGMLRAEQLGKVAVHLIAETLKISQPVKHFGRNHQHAFGLDVRHGRILSDGTSGTSGN